MKTYKTSEITRFYPVDEGVVFQFGYEELIIICEEEETNKLVNLIKIIKELSMDEDDEIDIDNPGSTYLATDIYFDNYKQEFQYPHEYMDWLERVKQGQIEREKEIERLRMQYILNNVIDEQKKVWIDLGRPEIHPYTILKYCEWRI